jgi:hypothetical protein
MRTARLLVLMLTVAAAACGYGTDPTEPEAPSLTLDLEGVDGLHVLVDGLPDAEPGASELLVFSPNGDGQLDNVTLSLAAAGPQIQEANRLFIRQGQLLTGTIVAGWGFSNYVPPPDPRVLGVVLWAGNCPGGVPCAEGEYRARGWSLQSSESDTPPRMVRLLIDRTAPAVTDLVLPEGEVATGSSVTVTAIANDALSPIGQAQLRVDDGAWQDMSAADGFLDGLTESVQGSFTAPATGSYLVCVRARDLGNTWSNGGGCASLVVGENSNQVPTASAGDSWSGDEGSPVALTGAGSDPDGGDVSYAWSVSDAGCNVASPASASTSVTCSDNGTFTATLTVTDDEGSVATDQALLQIQNVAPVVQITSPTDGSSFSLVLGALSVSAGFGDAGSGDSHTCFVKLTAGAEALSEAMPVSQGSCSGDVVPPEAGDYTLTVEVRDDDGAVGTASINLTVMGALSGAVTAGGWFAPLGEKAILSASVKYEVGWTRPRGRTDIDLHGPRLRFRATSFEWLLVNPDTRSVQYTGSGTLNGHSGYQFMVWLVDGGPGNPDTARLKIWVEGDEENVVFDSGAPTRLILGSVVMKK